MFETIKMLLLLLLLFFFLITLNIVVIDKIELKTFLTCLRLFSNHMIGR